MSKQLKPAEGEQPGQVSKRKRLKPDEARVASWADLQVYAVTKPYPGYEGEPDAPLETIRYPSDQVYLLHTKIFGELVSEEAGGGFPGLNFPGVITTPPDKEYFIGRLGPHGGPVRVWALTERGVLLANLTALLQDLDEIGSETPLGSARGVTHSHYEQISPRLPAPNEFVVLVNSGGQSMVFPASELRDWMLQRGNQAYGKFLKEVAHTLSAVK